MTSSSIETLHLNPDNEEKKNEIESVWDVLINTREQIKNKEISNLSRFIVELTNERVNNEFLQCSVLSSLASGSFWLDFYDCCTMLNVEFVESVALLEIFYQLVRFKSHLLFGIELLGIEKFNHLLNLQMVMAINVFEKYSLEKHHLKRMLQIPTDIGRILICRDMEDKSGSAFQALIDLGIIHVLEMLYTTLLTHKKLVRQLLEENPNFFEYYSELFVIVICIAINRPSMFFPNSNLVKSLFSSLGDIASALTTCEGIPDETKNLRNLRQREIDECGNQESPIRLSNLYSPETYHLFVYAQNSFILPVSRCLFFLFPFFGIFEQTVLDILRHDQEILFCLLDSMLQLLIRARILDFWNGNGTSVFSAGYILLQAFCQMKLIRRISSQSKIAKDVILWYKKWSHIVPKNSSNNSKTLQTQILYFVVGINYIRGFMNICFNPLCNSPNPKDVSNIQTKDDNTILRFLNENPLKISSNVIEIPILQKCSACFLVQYCSKKCQRSDWLHHKPYCISTRETRAVTRIKNDSKNTSTDNSKIAIL